MGEFALVIIAVALPSWRGQFAAGAVLCAASLLLWPLLPESGRWLYVQGRTHEAMEVSGCRLVSKGQCSGWLRSCVDPPKAVSVRWCLFRVAVEGKFLEVSNDLQ
jgi:hypothetical protein